MDFGENSQQKGTLRKDTPVVLSSRKPITKGNIRPSVRSPAPGGFIKRKAGLSPHVFTPHLLGGGTQTSQKQD